MKRKRRPTLTHRARAAARKFLWVGDPLEAPPGKRRLLLFLQIRRQAAIVVLVAVVLWAALIKFTGVDPTHVNYLLFVLLGYYAGQITFAYRTYTNRPRGMGEMDGMWQAMPPGSGGMYGMGGMYGYGGMGGYGYPPVTPPPDPPPDTK